MQSSSTLLRQTFINLCLRYSPDQRLIENMWGEISEAYSSENRHYHNLQHLYNMLQIINASEKLISNRDAVLFALYFHDFTYDTSRHDNEEASAYAAVSFLTKINAGQPLITATEKLILSTKSHKPEENGQSDTAVFLDADLSVLGSAPETYNEYAASVRKEFSQYPAQLYIEGRKRVLQHFLASDHIYKTDTIKTRLEQQARTNISNELRQLSL